MHRRFSILVATATAAVLVLTADSQIYDTNFYMLWEATAILAGDHPYRDFFEWGAPLAAYASAGMQLLVGYRLIGEFLLHWTFIVAGVVLAFDLGLRLARSAAAALVMLVAALIVVAYTPTYHYSKLFFLPLLVWLAWRYLDRPGPGRAAALAAATATAFLFRHDYGVYLGFGSALTLATALAAVPAMRRWPVVARDVAVYAAVTTAIVGPLAVLVETNEGIVTYVETRATRTPSVVDPAYYALLDPAPLRALVGAAVPPSSAGVEVLEQLLLLVPLALLASAARQGWRSRRSGAEIPTDVWRLAFAGVFLVVVDSGLFREPAYLVTLAPLTAALASRYLACGSGAAPVATGLRRALAVGLVLLGGYAALVWTRGSIIQQPVELVKSVPRAFTTLLASPPVAAASPLDGNPALSMAYLRECTVPGDRLIVTGSTPFQVNYYAERPFAGGHVYWHHGWRADPAHERQSLALILQHPVPFAFSTTDPVLKDFERYPRIHEYLVQHYSELPGSGGRALVDRRRHATRAYGPLNLPCFR